MPPTRLRDRPAHDVRPHPATTSTRARPRGRHVRRRGHDRGRGARGDAPMLMLQRPRPRDRRGVDHRRRRDRRRSPWTLDRRARTGHARPWPSRAGARHGRRSRARSAACSTTSSLGFYRSTFTDDDGRRARHRHHPVRGHRRPPGLPVLGRARRSRPSFARHPGRRRRPARRLQRGRDRPRAAGDGRGARRASPTP